MKTKYGSVDSKFLPNFVPISSDTRFATDIAATLLGCVQPIIPKLL